MSGNAKHYLLKVLGKAILLSSIGFSIASVEMSSKFSVKNFSTNQETLQNASEALDGYNLVGTLWALGVLLLMYGQYNWTGLIMASICNIAVLLWINLSYFHAFKAAADANGLEYPHTLFGLLS
jgi:hypothetical protein